MDLAVVDKSVVLPAGRNAPNVALAALVVLVILTVAILHFAQPAIGAPGSGAATLTTLEAEVATQPVAAQLAATDRSASDRSERASIPASEPVAVSDVPLGDLEVQVESAGSPSAGVLVALTHTDGHLATDVIGALPADANGLVGFDRTWCQPREPDACVCVDAAFPTLGAYAMQLEEQSERMHLFVPERGRVRIEVFEADGSPARQLALAEVRVLSATPPADRRHRYEVQNGSAEIDVEAAALLLEVRVTTIDGRSAEPLTAIGPALPDQVTVLSVKLAPRTMFTARLFDPHGQPLRNAAVEVRLAETSIRLDAGRPSDESGIVTFAGPKCVGGKPWRLRFLGRTADGMPLHGDLVADLSPMARASLDDIWLQHATRLVAGVCVDASGAPLAGVTLRLQVEASAEVQGPGLFGSRWRDVALGDRKTQADGSFVFHGPSLPGRNLRLRDRHDPGIVAPFVAGERALKFVMPARSKPGVLAAGR